jgi:hypothetical protein
LIKSHSGLRRNRKALLADLSVLVKMSRDPKRELNDDELDDLIMKAFKLVLRAVRFFDVWNEDVCVEQTIVESPAALDCSQMSRGMPLTPPADTPFIHHAAGTDLDQAVGSEINAPHRVSSGSPDTAMQRCREQANSDRVGRASVTFLRPETSQSTRSTQHTSRPASAQGKRISTVHRASFAPQSQSAPQSSDPQQLVLVSDKLSAFHDGFLGFLGSFIGLHLPSLSSTEVLVTTHQAHHACKTLLYVVEAVWERDFRRSKPLHAARDNMYDRLHDLITAAKDVFQPSDLWENGMPNPEDEKKLVDAATDCIRAAGACVAETRFVLEKIGDFEFETVGLGISPFEGVEFGPSGARQDEDQTEQDSVTIRPLSIPPQPTSAPPPPPSSIPQIPEPIQLESLPVHVESDARDSVRSHRGSAQSLLPPLPELANYHSTSGRDSASSQTGTCSSGDSPAVMSNGFRAQSVDNSSTGSTYLGSMRDSERSLVSSTSTRATSPDVYASLPSSLSKSFTGSQSSTFEEDSLEVETKILEKTFAHELILNRDGQVIGGSLPALIERLTTDDATPDAQFVSTFFLTFRLFTTPEGFAQALINRFNYVDDVPQIARRVWLRVFNVFKGWLESHWRMDCDRPALDLILPFAAETFANAMPNTGKRLMDLALKAFNSNGPLVPRLVSSMGKTNTAVAYYVAPDTPLPSSIITKSQLSLLKSWKKDGSCPSILDFDPLELARQLTIKESQIFCAILPEELLATEWTKKSGSMAVNVRAMSTLSTDLANLVVESILRYEEPNKRARLIKRWIKVAARCLELNNYDSLMAIICSLNTTTILRMKQTWGLLAAKTKATLEELRSIVDVSLNYTVLRQRLQNHVAPCLPFVGIYLTDLTFVDAGNQCMRQLPGTGPDSERATSVINFDKHVKTAKIISDLQRFQIPYRLHEVPELQTWIQDQLIRVRSSGQSTVQNHYRRSLMLEPRDVAPLDVKGHGKDKEGSRDVVKGHGKDKEGSKDKIEVDLPVKGGKSFLWSFPPKEKLGLGG